MDKIPEYPYSPFAKFSELFLRRYFVESKGYYPQLTFSIVIEAVDVSVGVSG